MKNSSNLLTAFAVLIIGIILSIGVQSKHNKAQLNLKNREIDLIIDNKTQAIQQQLLSGFSSVEILQYLFEKKDRISREEFQDYSVPLFHGNSGIKAISWVPGITLQERLKYETQLSKEFNFAGFTITQYNTNNITVKADKRAFYFPVTFIEPLSENKKAIGFDIYSNNARKATIDESIKKGIFQITPKIKLVQDTSGYGFLAIFPVHFPVASSNVSGSGLKVKGLISAVFKTDKLINEALAHTKTANVDLIVFDVTNHIKDFIYGTGKPIGTRQTVLTKKIEVAGREWELDFVINPDFFKIIDPSGYLLAGISVSLLVFLLLLWPFLKERRARVLSERLKNEQKVRVRTEKSLSEKEEYNRALFTQASIGMALTTVDGNFIDINQAFLNITGLTKEEAKSLTYWDITPEKYREQEAQILENLKTTGQFGPYEKEYIHKDGHLVPVNLHGKIIERNGVKYLLSSVEEISQRKKTEEALIESEERFRLFMNNSPAIAWMKDEKGHHVYINKTYENRFNVRFEDFIGKTDFELWPEEVAEKFRKNDLTVLETRQALVVTEDSILPGGERCYLLNYKFPFQSVSGNVFVAGIGIDITERILAEEKILKTSRMYAFISQINQTIVVTGDKDQLLESACRVAVNYGKFKMSWVALVDEATGEINPVAFAGDEDGYLSTFKNITINDSPGGQGPTASSILEGKHIVCDDFESDQRMRPWREEASKRGYRSSIALPLIVAGKVIGAYSLYSSVPGFFDKEEINLLEEVSKDICFALESIENRRKKQLAEETLLESEERYRLLLEVAPVGIAVLQDGKVVFTNPAGLKLLGADSYDQIIGYPITKIIHPDYLKDTLARTEKLINGENGNYPCEDLYVKFDGTNINVEVMATPLTYNLKPAVQVIITDITRRKLIEEENKRFSAELEHRVAERTAQLQSVNKELETFTYSVSHDLKAPLRGIDGYSKLLHDLYAPSLNEEARSFLNTIRSSTKQMNQLIDELLEYSRMERSTMRSDKIRIIELIDAILSLYKPELESGMFSLKMNVPDVEIIADSKGFTIALRNLLENAMKFTKVNSYPTIEINLEETVDSWVLSVKDNGIGFDMKYHERIYEIFQRLHRVEDFPGTGIGLAMVHKVMQRMHGRIWAESIVGTGSTFFLEFPKYQPI